MPSERRGREPREGTVFLSTVLAGNIRARRGLRRLSQEQVASGMRSLGHATWTRATVSEVERNGRTVSFEEFFGLAAALGASPLDLVRPDKGTLIDLGDADPLPAHYVEHWLSGWLRLEQGQETVWRLIGSAPNSSHTNCKSPSPRSTPGGARATGRQA